MPLDVASAGDSAAQARTALDEAVHLFQQTAAAQGTLDEILEESGYEHEADHWRRPAWVAIERHHALVGV